MQKLRVFALSAVVLLLAGCSSHAEVASNAAPFLKTGQDYCMHFSDGFAGEAGAVKVLGVSGDFVKITPSNPKDVSAGQPKSFWVNARLINALSAAPCEGG